jgi:hypothetical protein
METKNKRQILMINKRFQYGLIIRFILVNIFILAVYGGFLYLFLDNEIQSNLFSAHVFYKSMKEMMLPIILTLSALNIIVSSIIISVIVLYTSHRIAGPLYRFKTVIHEICQKNLQPFLTLRKKDELFPLSEILQEMVQMLRKDGIRIQEIQMRLKEINQKENNIDLATEIENLEEIIQEYVQQNL